MNENVPGKVTIAPEVLVTIAQLTAQDVRGVRRMSVDWTRGMNRVFGVVHTGDGVQVRVKDSRVRVDLYIVVDHDVGMLQIGRRVQAEVTRAIEKMVGMEIEEVNVHVEDVCYPPAEA